MDGMDNVKSTKHSINQWPLACSLFYARFDTKYRIPARQNLMIHATDTNVPSSQTVKRKQKTPS